MAAMIGGAPRSVVTASTIKAVPATKRMRSKPAPGHPWAKVENNRRNAGSG